MAVTKCVRHGMPITADGCPECSRIVEEAISSAQRHRTIPVGPAATAEIVRLRDENRQLRIERDNAREMEDVHGDNWEAARAEVERLRKMQHCDDCVHEPECSGDSFPETCSGCGRYYSDMWRAKA